MVFSVETLAFFTKIEVIERADPLRVKLTPLCRIVFTYRGFLRGPGDARPETKPWAGGGFAVATIDFRTDPVTARRHRVVSLITHADIPDIVWADDETGCYGVRCTDAKGNRIVVERSGPIRIVSARR